RGAGPRPRPTTPPTTTPATTPATMQARMPVTPRSGRPAAGDLRAAGDRPAARARRRATWKDRRPSGPPVHRCGGEGLSPAMGDVDDQPGTVPGAVEHEGPHRQAGTHAQPDEGLPLEAAGEGALTEGRMTGRRRPRRPGPYPWILRLAEPPFQ